MLAKFRGADDCPYNSTNAEAVLSIKGLLLGPGFHLEDGGF